MSIFSVFENVESIDSRNEMVSVLVEFFSSLDQTEAQIYTYLLQGRVAPLFVNAEFNFSERSAMKVLEDINRVYEIGLDVEQLRIDYGDAGSVAQEVLEKKGQVESVYNVLELYDYLCSVVNAVGVNSMKHKSEMFSTLLQKSSPVDAKFLTRLVSGKLRLGCSSKTLLDTFSFLLVSDKSLRKDLDKAYGMVSDLGLLANIVCSSSSYNEKADKLASMEPVLGVPIFPRLVERVSSFEELSERFPDGGVIQPKFDGLRCQIHKGVGESRIYDNSVWVKYFTGEGSGSLFSSSVKSDIKLFSRNLNDITEMFPDIVEEVAQLDCSSCIIDGEIVGEDKNGFTSFQDTMTRKRKYGVEKKAESVPVKYFAFDLLYLNSKNLMGYPLERRTGEIGKIFTGENYIIKKTDNIIFEAGSNYEKVKKVFEQYIEENLEGVVVKASESIYLPGVRDFDWVKVKKSIEGRVVDTIDAVILGYYYGSGKKVGFGMGSLLIGIYNRENDVFESVGKVGTGFTDEDWEKVSERLNSLVIEQKPERVFSDLKPDVWVYPEVSITVEADEISKSSAHTACKSALGFGLSLRFPRLIEFDRDKLPEDITSSQELVQMWNTKHFEQKT